MANLGTFLVLSMAAISSIVLYEYGMTSLGSTDMGVNLTGTQYVQSYNASVNTSVVAYSYLQYQPMLLGAIALMFMLLILASAL